MKTVFAALAFALVATPTLAQDPTVSTNITVNHFAGHGLYTAHPNDCDPDTEEFIQVEHIEEEGGESTGFCVEREARPAASWPIAVLRCLHQEKRLPEVDEFYLYICPYRDARGNPFSAPAATVPRGVEWLANETQTVYREGSTGSDGTGLTASTVVPRSNIRDCAYSDFGIVAQSSGGRLAQSSAFFRCVH